MTPEIDELKLTAYALGELDGPECAAERAELEAHLAADEAARRHVEEVRATARLVSAELSAELSALSAGPLAGLTALQHAAIERRLERAGLGEEEAAAGPFPLRPIRRNWAMWGSLAASIVIVCTVMAGVLPMIYHPGNPLGQRQGPGTAPGDGNPSQGPGPIVVDPGPLPSPSPGSRDALAGPGGYGAPEVGPFPSAAPPLTNGERGFIRVSDFPLSTVPTASVWPDDAERGSFPAVRRALENRHLPPAELVRTDEIVNAFPYHYAAPAAGEPVAAGIEVATCPWNPSHRLLRVGLRTADAAPATQPAGPAGGPTTRPAGTGLAGMRVQVEFNPAVAGAYRLLGYENGAFGSDARYEGDDARAVGRGGARTADGLRAGRTMTALYEVVPASEVVDAGPAGVGSALKYQKLTPVAPTEGAAGGAARRELVTVTVRLPASNTGTGAEPAARSLEFPVADEGRTFAEASEDFRTAATAAEFAMVLRHSPYKGTASYDQMIETASRGAAEDPASARAVLLDLARRAKALDAGR